MKNYRLTKTKTYLEEKDYKYTLYCTRFVDFDKYFFPTFLDFFCLLSGLSSPAKSEFQAIGPDRP